MKKPGPEGFGALALVGLVVALGLLGLTERYVWIKNQPEKSATPSSPNTSKQKSEDTTIEESQAADVTAGWKRVESVGGAYSFMAPDGWELQSYPGGTINSSSLELIKGTPASVTVQTNAFAGDQRAFNIGVSDGVSSGPQWKSPNEYGAETATDYNLGSIRGKRYTIEFTETVTGVTKGDKVYQYSFEIPGNRHLYVVYMYHSGQEDIHKTVEQLIQSVTLL